MGIPAEMPQQVETVLVVDDDENCCFVAKKLLKKAAVGKQVVTAANGLDALEKLQGIAASGGRLPGLILLDIKMPVMDGFGFLEEVAKAPELDLRATRIYVCTSSFLAKDRERAGQYQVSGFITKPLTHEVLVDILHPDWSG